MSTSFRRSLRCTSAARTIRFSLSECAIIPSVRMLQGATIIPSVRNVPLASGAERSFSSWTTSASASTSATFQAVSYSMVAFAPDDTIACVSTSGWDRITSRSRIP